MALTRLQSDLEAREESVDLTPPRGDAATAKVNSVDNLPQELSSFVGRNHEIASCLELLESSRIVTLTGAGGIGKSRLLGEISREAQERGFAVHKASVLDFGTGRARTPCGCWLGASLVLPRRR